MDEKNILKIIKFLSWIFLGLLIIFIGLSKTYALTGITSYANADLTGSNQYYAWDMNGSALVRNIGTNYTGRTSAIRSFLNLSTSINKNYRIRINFYGDDLEKSVNSQDVHIKSYNGSDWVDVNLINIAKQNSNGYSTWLDMTFNVTQASTKLWIEIYKDDNSGGFITGTQYYGINSIQYEVIDPNTDIMNNANANANNIINNNNNNTQNIIDNQNSSTQAIIDNNKETFNSCYTNLITSLNVASSATVIRFNGVTSSQSYQFPAGTYTFSYQKSTTDNITVYYRTSSSSGNQLLGTNTSYTISATESFNVWLYKSGGGLSTSDIGNIMLIDSAYDGDILELGAEGCINVLKEQEKTSKGIFGKLKELFNTLFSNDDADISGLNNMVGWLPPGPVDSIINLPLAFFNALTNTLSGTCVDVSLTIPFVNQTLTLPCFDTFMSQYLSNFSTIWTWVGVTVSIFILYNYLLSLYKWIDDTLTMRENNLPGYYGDNMWGGM